MNSCFPRALLVTALAVPLGHAQSNTPWRDGLDDLGVYSVGQDPTQPSVGGWEQWDLVANPGAAIQADKFRSGPHSLFIGRSTDVVQKFAQGAAEWVIGTSVYVPTTGPRALSRDAFFILLNTYSVQGPKGWSLQLRFEPASGLVRFVGGPNAGVTTPFLADQWSDLRVDVDLDADIARVFYGKPGLALPFGPPFTWSEGAGGNGSSDLQALDLFANDQQLGQNPLGGLYFDELFVEPLAPPASWNRVVRDIAFAPGPVAGSVDVTAHWSVAFEDTNAFTDLSTKLELYVNGQPSGSPLIKQLLVRESSAECSGVKLCPDCDETPCATTGNTLEQVEGICDEDYEETCLCKCTAIIDSEWSAISVSSGDSVEVRVLAAPGSVPESYLLDDSLTEVFPGLCAGITYCIPKSGLVCGQPAISATGYASASLTSGFLVSAAPAVSNKTGILLYSDLGRAMIPFTQGGHVLCIPSMGLRRAGTTHTGTGPQCSGVFSVDMNAFAHGLWAPPGGGPSLNPAPYLLIPGKTINCQFWGRDSMATGSFMSDGLEYLVCP